MDGDFDIGKMTLEDQLQSMEIYLKSITVNVNSILENIKRGVQIKAEEFENAETIVFALASNLSELKEVFAKDNR